MSRSIDFRSALPGDAVSIAALATQVFLDTYATAGVRPDLAREAFREYSEPAFAARLCDPQRNFILAVRGEALIGFAELLTPAASPLIGIAGTELVRLYVQPQAQRSGVGKRLIGESEHAAAALSASSLWLTAWDGNTSALAFYRRMGYADKGATTYAFEGNTYGNRIFAKRVTAG